MSYHLWHAPASFERSITDMLGNEHEGRARSKAAVGGNGSQVIFIESETVGVGSGESGEDGMPRLCAERRESGPKVVANH